MLRYQCSWSSRNGAFGLTDGSLDLLARPSAECALHCLSTSAGLGSVAQALRINSTKGGPLMSLEVTGVHLTIQAADSYKEPLLCLAYITLKNNFTDVYIYIHTLHSPYIYIYTYTHIISSLYIYTHYI